MRRAKSRGSGFKMGFGGLSLVSGAGAHLAKSMDLAATLVISKEEKVVGRRDEMAAGALIAAGKGL
jgi:hypothetical protein